MSFPYDAVGNAMEPCNLETMQTDKQMQTMDVETMDVKTMDVKTMDVETIDVETMDVETVETDQHMHECCILLACKKNPAK